MMPILESIHPTPPVQPKASNFTQPRHRQVICLITEWIKLPVMSWECGVDMGCRRPGQYLNQWNTHSISTHFWYLFSLITGFSESGDCQSFPSTNEIAERIEYVIPVDPDYDIPMDHVKVNRRLGQGAFGLVFRGSLKRLPGGKKGPVSVAVKTLRGKFGILF